MYSYTNNKGSFKSHILPINIVQDKIIKLYSIYHLSTVQT